MSNALTFQKVMEKYRFREPVTPELQKTILLTKQPVLVAALKSLGEYGFFYGLALRIFFTLRRYGVRASVLQSQVIMAVLGALLTGLMGAALYIISIPRPHAVPGEKQETVKPLTLPDRAKPVKEKEASAPLPVFRIAVEDFSADNVDNATAAMVTGRIRQSLMAGPIGSSLRNDPSGKVNILLVGSVGKMGSLHLVAARVVDIEKGKVLYTTSENAASRNDLDRACDFVTARIENFMAEHGNVKYESGR